MDNNIFLDTSNSLLKNDLIQKKTKLKDMKEEVENSFISLKKDEKQVVKDIITEVGRLFKNRISAGTISENEYIIEIKRLVRELPAKYTDKDRLRIEQSCIDDMLGYGVISKYYNDPEVSEIIVQTFDNIVIEKNGKIQNVPEKFSSDDELVDIINRIVGRIDRTITVTEPIVDARTKEGNRVNATIKPVSPDGATLDIRKFSSALLGGQDYVEKGSISQEMLNFLQYSILAKTNCIVSGGTGSGKTTLLNMLSNYIPDEELIVTIEDSLELQLHQKNIRRLETRFASEKSETKNVDAKELVKNALRMRPDRILLGEIRDNSIIDMFSAMSTGHEGSLSTIHANSPSELVNNRIPVLFLQGDSNFSEKFVSLQVVNALDLIVQIKRLRDGSRKITNIAEVTGEMTPDYKIITKDIFYFDERDNQFKYSGYYPKRIMDKIQDLHLDYKFPYSESESKEDIDEI